jgi:AGZA family xanthine/uracil permease-like MFS transporter
MMQKKFKTELLAGVTTFLTSMYIIIVNPAILSQAGMPPEGALTATVMVSAISTVLMGWYAKNPILVAPGMGLNAFFTFTLVKGMGVAWQTALGAVFWSGIIFLLLSIFNVRNKIIHAIPVQLRYGIATGIGLFIALIGFINAGFLTANPATLITRSRLGPELITFVIGLAATAFFVIRKFRGALILGIIFTTILSILLGRLYGSKVMVLWPQKGMVAWPDFSLFMQLDIMGSLKFSLLPVIFTFCFTDLFDSISTFVGVAEAGNLLDENHNPKNIKESMIVDSISTIISGIFGTSSGTAYIESATGIKEGGATGMTAVVAGLLFLPFLFLSPLLTMVPAIATSTALVLVGVFMIKPVLKINWLFFEEAIPAFLAMVLIPFTYSITDGIIWSFLSWTLLKIFAGKGREVPLSLYILDLFMILALVMGK